MHGKTRCRQCIQHLVGEQYAAPFFLRRPVQPGHALEQGTRQRGGKAFALALTQVGGRLQDGVARRHGLQHRQMDQHILRERAAAATQLQKLSATHLLQYRRNGLGHALGKQRPQFRRGDKISGASELVRPGAVIAQSRRIQGQLHVARKRNRPAFGGYGRAQRSDQFGTVRTRKFFGFRQVDAHAVSPAESDVW